MFFRSEQFRNQSAQETVAIVVTHLVEDARIFLKILKEQFNDLIVIPKNSSKTDLYIKEFSDFSLILNVSRFDILNESPKFLENLDSFIKKRKFIIFDMGGYFSSQIHYLNERKSQFLGIVEDTENGHLRYESVCNGEEKPLFPIISVARSTLKDPEDILVGQAISFSIEKVMRSRLEVLVSKTVCVVGFGKIGKGICNGLRARGANVFFYDHDSIKTVRGLALGFNTGKKEKLISQSDIIISATGNKALSRNDLMNAKKDAYIFSATSSDDEFQKCLLDCFESEFSAGVMLSSKKDFLKNNIFLCNKGNSINFLDGAVVDRYIELVQAEIIFSASVINDKKTGLITEITDQEKRFIADLWLNHYFDKC